jgi:hypothetical protein
LFLDATNGIDSENQIVVVNEELFSVITNKYLPQYFLYKGAM